MCAPAKITDQTKDAFYVAVGFGVLAVQRVMAGRRDLLEMLDERLGDSRRQPA